MLAAAFLVTTTVWRRPPPPRLVAMRDVRSQLDALIRQTPSEVEGYPLVAAGWTYYPGVREILRVHEPALTFVFTELLGDQREYVHCLEGATIGTVVEVLECRSYATEMFALVHAKHRVKLAEPARRGSLRRGVRCEPFLDQEELAEHATPAEAFGAARELALVDDPLDDVDPAWLTGTVRTQSPPEDRHLLTVLEKEVWADVDQLVGLIKKSRTSGAFELPDALLRLRYRGIPPHRRLLRLSFALDALLGLDRAAERQRLIDFDSTEARIAFVRSRLQDDTRNLAASLALEAIAASPPPRK